MNKAEQHYSEPASSSEHGTMKSYVIGFILSLILTIDAYFLVKNHILKGNVLLVTILAMGVVQMAIQLLFFLHLGRGPKPFYNIVFFFGTFGIIVVTIGASLFIMHNLYRNMSPDEVILKLSQDEGIAQVNGEQTGACQGLGKNYKVTIKDSATEPGFVQAVRCDTISFVNESGKSIKIAFGTPADPESYGGQDTITAAKGYPKNITLNQAGSFTYYNKDNPNITGQFSVAPQ